MPPKKSKGSAAEAPRPLLGRPSNNVSMGIVGLPNVGKSTFFNLMCNMSVPAENYAFCTLEPTEARVPVAVRREHTGAWTGPQGARRGHIRSAPSRAASPFHYGTPCQVWLAVVWLGRRDYQILDFAQHPSATVARRTTGLTGSSTTSSPSPWFPPSWLPPTSQAS